MRWKSKKEPLVEGLAVSVERFAYLPRKMEDGTWVWLEKYSLTRHVERRMTWFPFSCEYKNVWRNGLKYAIRNKENTSNGI